MKKLTTMHSTVKLLLSMCMIFAMSIMFISETPLSDPLAQELIIKLEKLMYPNAKVSGNLVFTDSAGRSESYSMIMYTKDRNQKIIVRFTAPPDSVGNDILMIEKNVWVYNKRSNRIIKVPSNQAFGGTGFSYGDVVRLNYSDNYNASIIQQNQQLYKLELIAKDRNAPYYRIELELDRAGGYPVQSTCFAKSGAVLKTIVYSGVKNAGLGRKPMIISQTSPDAPNESTVMTLLREEGRELPDRIFNKRNLEARVEENL